MRHTDMVNESFVFKFFGHVNINFVIINPNSQCRVSVKNA